MHDRQSGLARMAASWAVAWGLAAMAWSGLPTGAHTSSILVGGAGCAAAGWTTGQAHFPGRMSSARRSFFLALCWLAGFLLPGFLPFLASGFRPGTLFTTAYYSDVGRVLECVALIGVLIGAATAVLFCPSRDHSILNSAVKVLALGFIWSALFVAGFWVTGTVIYLWGSVLGTLPVWMACFASGAVVGSAVGYVAILSLDKLLWSGGSRATS